MTERDRIIETLAGQRKNLEQLGVLRLGVFGSRARGDAQPDSDLDVLVEFRESAMGSGYFDRYCEVRALLERLLQCRIDLVTAAGVKPELRRHIERDLIYAVS